MSDQHLRIAIADDEPEIREYFEDLLEHLGHEVVGAAVNGGELVDLCAATHPDLVITDVRMPGLDGIEASFRICRERELPVIVVTAYHDPDTIERALQDHVQVYLVKPIKDADVPPAIALAMKRFAEIQDLQRRLGLDGDDHDLLERAKQRLISEEGLDERSVTRRLQALSEETGKSLAEVARWIVEQR